MPAEWEPHEATWIAWPHHQPDWPGKFETIPPVYAEIVHSLAAHERVEILCHDEEVESSAASVLEARGVARDSYRLHRVPTDRSWLRDSAPTFVLRDGGTAEMLNWAFNAWAKYDNYSSDVKIGEAMQRVTGIERAEPMRPDGKRLVLEGGGIEVNGAGRMLVTAEWLLSDIQVRNPGMTRYDYESEFREWLGITETIWLGEGTVGDDTHGHIDDVARFSSADTVLIAHEEDPADENHRRSQENIERLRRHPSLRVVTLPYPRPVMMEGERLPASYANFYIANGVVIVPTFDDPNDRVALETIRTEFPGRQVKGIHSVDLVWGLGTLHCLSQQQPAAQR